MSLFSIFDISGSALKAQTVRLNTTASNMANSETLAGSQAEVYRARQPLFSTIFDTVTREVKGVEVVGIAQDKGDARKEYAPANPIADEDGYIYHPNVNMVEEMANMISASRSFQSNIEVMNTSKQMLLSVLRLGE